MLTDGRSSTGFKREMVRCLITAWAFCAAASAQAGPITDLEECYGETLEIKMPSTFGDGVETEFTHFSLPNPNAWLVNIGNGKLLDDVPCQADGALAEPVRTRKLWGGFIDPRLGHAQKTLDVEGGLRLHTLRISSPDLESIVQSEAWRLARTAELGQTDANGYLRRASVDNDAVGGNWYFPESYLSPVGTRIRMGCALTCGIEYRLDRNLHIRYQLVVPDRDRHYDWIAIDRVARAIILGWITQPDQN